MCPNIDYAKMSDVAPATIKKIRSLIQIATDLRPGKHFSLTRLTMPKSLCSNPRFGTDGHDVQITAPLPPNPAPTLLSITPDSGSPDADAPVQIEGSNFIEIPSLRLGDTWLVDVVQVSPTLLTAVVPAGMAEGVYDLVLYNGDCQVATLSDAFTVGGGPYDTMHVDGIRMRYRDRGGGRYLLMAIVRIVDQDRQAVPEATVSVEWTPPDASTETQQADTDARSMARFRIKSLVPGTFEIFTVSTAGCMTAIAFIPPRPMVSGAMFSICFIACSCVIASGSFA